MPLMNNVHPSLIMAFSHFITPMKLPDGNITNHHTGYLKDKSIVIFNSTYEPKTSALEKYLQGPK